MAPVPTCAAATASRSAPATSSSWRPPAAAATDLQAEHPVLPPPAPVIPSPELLFVGVQLAQDGNEGGFVAAGVVQHGHQRVQDQVPLLARVQQPLGRVPQLRRVAAP